MSNVVDRLKRLMSYSEVLAFKAIYVELGEETEVILINGKIGDKLGIARSTIVNGLRLLDAVGAIETRSLGAKGTHIRVLNREVLEAVAKFY